MADSPQKYEIHSAAMEGKALVVRGLLAQNPRLAIQRDLDNRTPIHWAAAKYPEICKVLLNPFDESIAASLEGTQLPETSEPKNRVKPFEIDIDELTDDSGWTPLHIAVSAGNLESVNLFLNHSPAPDVNLQTSMGQTCLHYAVSKNYVSIVQTLLDHGASTKVKDKRGQYPLHRAASVGSVGLVKLLAEKARFFIDAKDSSGWTALHHALAEGHGDAAVLLVKLGADPTIEDRDGLTPLKVSVDEKVAQFFTRGCEAEGIDI